MRASISTVLMLHSMKVIQGKATVQGWTTSCLSRKTQRRLRDFWKWVRRWILMHKKRIPCRVWSWDPAFRADCNFFVAALTFQQIISKAWRKSCFGSCVCDDEFLRLVRISKSNRSMPVVVRNGTAGYTIDAHARVHRAAFV